MNGIPRIMSDSMNMQDCDKKFLALYNKEPVLVLYIFGNP